MTIRRWVLLGILLGACACNKGKDQKASGSSAAKPLPPPPTTPLAATIGDKVTPVPNARIELRDDKLEVVFSSVAIACGNALKEEEGVAVSFDVPAGPASGYFAGKPFGLAVRVSPPHAGVDYHDVSAHSARITLEPFTPAKGAHVKGTVVAEADTKWTPKQQKFAAIGAFDAVICEDKRTKTPPPPEPAIGPAISGTVEKRPFTGASALASVFKSSTGPIYLDSIDVYAEPGVTCANRNAKDRENLRIKAGGGGADAPLLGSPQPASLSWEKATRTAESMSSTSSSASSSVRSWVTFESISFEAGGKVSASVVATTPDSSDDKWSFGGKVVAEVCRYEL